MTFWDAMDNLAHRVDDLEREKDALQAENERLRFKLGVALSLLPVARVDDYHRRTGQSREDGNP